MIEQKYTEQRCESSRDAEISRLWRLEAKLTAALRTLRIASTEARHLFALRDRVRQEIVIILEASLNRDEQIGSIARREIAAMAAERSTGGAA